MQNFWFYTQLGLNHVLDFNAYDHILFLIALAVPFTFKSWKKVLLLATVFTIAHCFSLALSSYGVLDVHVGWVEFLIPVTIAMTAVLNLVFIKAGVNDTNSKSVGENIGLHMLATLFFGLIHGLGFSNYFKMLMAGEADKLSPLLGFALGIEISQVIVVISVMVVSFVISSLTPLRHFLFAILVSILIILATIPMLIATFPL